MRVLIFGTGYQYQKRKKQLNNMTVVAFLDNSEKKQGTYLDGILVDKPENVHLYTYDYVLLLSDYYQEMRSQLIELAVLEEKIIDKKHRGVFDLWSTEYIKKYKVKHVKDRLPKKRILLYSHELSLTGAPRVLYNMACVLKDAGYYVEVYSREEGKLIYEFLQQGISVSIINSEDTYYYLDEEEVEENFDLIVVNTICCYELVKRFADKNIPLIWWLHESELVYEQLGLIPGEFMTADNIYVYGVGYKATDAFRKYFNKDIDEFLYGLKKVAKEKKQNFQKEKLVFSLIGYVCDNKGQNILVDAICANWEDWKTKADFLLIGQIDEKTRKKYETLGKIKVLGQLEHDAVLEKYELIDVIVCASKQETMSITVNEGMMQKKVCIVSDGAGNSQYIENYKNGLLCHAGDVNSLASAIQWVLDHPEKHEAIGEQAYQVYQENFSYEQFEKRVLEIVKSLI